MKVDNNTLRQLTLGLDSSHNGNKARSAESGAFGQLFASMTQTSRTAQDGAAEAVPTARLSKKQTGSDDEQAKVQADAEPADRHHDDGDGDSDAVRESAAGAAGAKQQTDDKQAVKGEKVDDDRIAANTKPQAAGQAEATADVEQVKPAKTDQPQHQAAKLQAQAAAQQADDAAADQQPAQAVQAAGDGASDEPVQQVNVAAGDVADVRRKQEQQKKDAAAKIDKGDHAAAPVADSSDAKPQAAAKAHQPSHATAQQQPVAANAQPAATADAQAQQATDQKSDAVKPVSSGATSSGGASATPAIAPAAAPAAQHANVTAMHAGQPATPDTLTDAEAQQVVTKAVGSVRSIASQGSGQGAVTLRLNPPELGALRISVRMDGPMMSATFEASSNSVSNLLQSQLHSLRASLEHAGLGVEQLNVQGPSPLPSPNGSQFSSMQQQMHQSPSDGRSRGMMSQNGGQNSGQNQQREQQTSSPGFQRELLDLVA